MAVVTEQKIRAKIEFGNVIVETPDVVSFSVHKARGQMSATFSASIRVSYNDISSANAVIAEQIVIKAGLKNRLNTIFTGKIFKCVINPVRSDASKVMLNLSGRDVLSDLEGQKINRRVKTYRDGSSPPERFGVINSIIKRETSRIEKFPEKIISNTPKAVNKLPIIPAEITPEAFKLKADIDRLAYDKPVNSLSVEIIEKSSGGSSQEGGT